MDNRTTQQPSLLQTNEEQSTATQQEPLLQTHAGQYTTTQQQPLQTNEGRYTTTPSPQRPLLQTNEGRCTTTPSPQQPLQTIEGRYTTTPSPQRPLFETNEGRYTTTSSPQRPLFQNNEGRYTTTSSPQRPLLRTNKQRYKLDKVPLITTSCFSVLTYFLAIYFGLRYGFVVSVLGETVAMQGTMMLVLLNICFTYWTLKVISIVTTRKYPTWPLLSDLRDTIVKLGTGTIVGNALFLATIYWYNHYGHIKGSATPNIEERSLDRLNALADLNVSLAQDGGFNDTMQEFLHLDYPHHRNDMFIGNDTLLLGNSTDGSSYLSENATDDVAQLSRNATGFGNSSLQNGTEEHNISNSNSTPPPENGVSPSSRNNTVGQNISKSKLKSVRSISSKDYYESGSSNPKVSTIRADKNDYSPHFVSLFACSFTFCTAGAVTIIALFVEKRSINLLREREENANTKSWNTSTDTATHDTATHITAISNSTTRNPTHKTTIRNVAQGKTSTFFNMEGKLSPSRSKFYYDPKLAEASAAYDGGSEAEWQSRGDLISNASTSEGPGKSKLHNLSLSEARARWVQRNDHRESTMETVPCVDHVLPPHQKMHHDVKCTVCGQVVKPSNISVIDPSLTPAKIGKTTDLDQHTISADIHEASQGAFASVRPKIRSPTKPTTVHTSEKTSGDKSESNEAKGSSTESNAAFQLKENPATTEALECIEMTSKVQSKKHD